MSSKHYNRKSEKRKSNINEDKDYEMDINDLILD